MARVVAAVFPDRAMADRAMQVLRDAGFAPYYAAEGRVADQVADTAGEQRGFTLEADPQAREADLRDLLMHAGALSLQGLGTDGPGHTISPTTEEDRPIPVRDGERMAPGAPSAAGNGASDHEEKGDAAGLNPPPPIRHGPLHAETVDEVRRNPVVR